MDMRGRRDTSADCPLEALGRQLNVVRARKIFHIGRGISLVGMALRSQVTGGLRHAVSWMRSVCGVPWRDPIGGLTNSSRHVLSQIYVQFLMIEGACQVMAPMSRLR